MPNHFPSEGLPIESADDGVLSMFSGASFGPEGVLRLPSGRILVGDEGQAFVSAFGDDAGWCDQSTSDGCPHQSAEPARNSLGFLYTDIERPQPSFDDNRFDTEQSLPQSWMRRFFAAVGGITLRGRR